MEPLETGKLVLSILWREGGERREGGREGGEGGREGGREGGKEGERGRKERAGETCNVSINL